MKGLFKWFKKRIEIALVDEYLVEIWFAGSENKTRKEFRLGKINEISQNHIKGRTLDGGRFELKTTEVFDYNVIQLK
jgi:hypothetical protein